MSLPSTSNLPTASDNKVAASTNDQSASLDEGQTISGNQITDTNESALVNRKPRQRAQFTRGEKCLFFHLVVTFGILLLLFVLYLVHSYWVKHHGYDMFDGLALRLGAVIEKSDYMPVGMVHVLPNYYMCNSLLLRPRWSLAPAHCVAARSDPDLAYTLPNWRITYGSNYDYSTNTDDTENYIETMIIRGIAHPHFNRDDFQNNIGLFQHEDSILVFSYTIIKDDSLNDDTLMKKAADLKLIAWEDSWQVHAPGAVLATKTDYLGMFAWGDSSGQHLPFIILDLANYKNWIFHIISIYAV